MSRLGSSTLRLHPFFGARKRQAAPGRVEASLGEQALLSWGIWFCEATHGQFALARTRRSMRQTREGRMLKRREFLGIASGYAAARSFPRHSNHHHDELGCFWWASHPRKKQRRSAT